MIKLENVSKKLGNFTLNNISMELPPGFVMGLVGANGAGKTSLLHLIMGLYTPNEGRITIEGKNYEEDTIAIRQMMGVVLAEDLYNGGSTLLENGDDYGRFYENYDRELFLSYLERFRLSKDDRLSTLSKGAKLKFQFAFALSHGARLLILDEPTGNFDPRFREEFFKILKEFIADGTRSVVLATHLTGDLDMVADYVMYLDKGNTVFAGDIETMRDGYRLLTGERYKINLLRRENVVHIEEGIYGTRALVHHKKRYEYDTSLTVAVPTIEEIMYFTTKRRGK